MRNIGKLFMVGVMVGLLGGAGCGAAQKPVELGALTASESPPSAQELYFEEKPGHVWVHGRWARLDGQWVWQTGHHQPAQPGKVWMNGYWDRKDGAYVWIEGRWGNEREGQVFVPGYFDQRGNANVWIRDRWEPVRPGEVWVAGAWTKVDGEARWTDGHWETQTAITETPKRKR